jgi:putative flippase GtrA
MNANAPQCQRARLTDLASLALQFGRFGLVGITNAGISAGVDAFLLFVGMPSPLAAAAAFAAGAVNGYVLNRRWTFAAADSRRTRMAYAVVQLSGLGCTVALVSAIDSLLHISHFGSYIAASVPVTLAMFFANRAWTFSHPRRSGSARHRAASSGPRPRNPASRRNRGSATRHRAGRRSRLRRQAGERAVRGVEVERGRLDHEVVVQVLG